jgi:hypothetical protein
MCTKSYKWDLIPRPSSPQQGAIPTALFHPLKNWDIICIHKVNGLHPHIQNGNHPETDSIVKIAKMCGKPFFHPVTWTSHHGTSAPGQLKILAIIWTCKFWRTFK